MCPRIEYEVEKAWKNSDKDAYLFRGKKDLFYLKRFGLKPDAYKIVQESIKIF